MITLRRGDRLPTVTVLQSYLNQQPSTREYLAVDSIFGPRTEAAVWRFCTSSGIGRSGRVDYDVWRGIVGAEWQIIDSVDQSDHDARKRKHRIDDQGSQGGSGLVAPGEAWERRKRSKSPSWKPFKEPKGGSGLG